MKKIILRILLLFAVFVGSLFIFMLMLNRHDAFSTKAMAKAALPVLYMREDGAAVNRMYGYRQQVNEKTFRETLTPVSVDRNLTVEIQERDAGVNDVTYQVTSLEDGSVIENGRLSLDKSGENIVSEFSLKEAVAVGREYMLRFSVDIGEDEPVYYYTRLVDDSGQTLSYYLEYADAFYQSCINDNMTDDMISQMETESSSANSSLHYVTLKSDIEQMTWDDLDPALVKKAVPSILEVNETTVSVGMEYVISAKDEEERTEYYTVSEYYRMRRDQEDIILLDYERTAVQLFDGSLSVLTDDGINLGVTGRDLEYAADPDAGIAAFVQAGELWQYDRNSNKVCRLFGFRDESGAGEIYGNNLYDISISSVADNGDTTFVVYGYMCAGDHEGRLGISIYKYLADTNVTQEILFIPLSDGYQIMSRGLSVLSYVNSKDECFLYYDDTIYKVELADEPEVSRLQEDLNWQAVSVSDSQTLIAWGEGGEGYPDSLNELNLETGELITLDAPEGDYIKTLGFVGEDLVYGLAHSENCYTDSSGNEVFPMYKVSIADLNGETVRNYQTDNIYITSVNIENGLITLKRSYYNDEGRLAPTTDDQLLYYAPESDSYVSVSLKVSERNGTQVHLVFSAWGAASNLLNMDTRYPSGSAVKILEIPEMVYDSDYYYVYAHGGLYEVYDRINNAIIAADENVGVVLDSGQRYVWERGNVKESFTIDIANIPAGMLSAPVDEEKASEAVGEEYDIINLTGCSLDSIRYQISNGYAVAGQWSTDRTALIVGYDIYDNIWIYNAETGEADAVAFEEAQAAFEENGNIFISYSKN